MRAQKMDKLKYFVGKKLAQDWSKNAGLASNYHAIMDDATLMKISNHKENGVESSETGGSWQ